MSGITYYSYTVVLTSARIFIRATAFWHRTLIGEKRVIKVNFSPISVLCQSAVGCITVYTVMQLFVGTFDVKGRLHKSQTQNAIRRCICGSQWKAVISTIDAFDWRLRTVFCVCDSCRWPFSVGRNGVRMSEISYPTLPRLPPNFFFFSAFF